MKCNSCGHENKQGAKFCDSCGSRIGANHCPECGHENRGGAQFCKSCGASLKGAPRAAAQPAASVVKKAGMSTTAIILLSVAGFLVVAGGAVFLLRDMIDLSFLGLSSSASSAAQSSNVAKITYTTNPAPIVQVGEPFELVYDWNATTKELVQEFIDNSEQQVLVNGKLATAKVTYSSIVEDILNGGFKTQVSTDVGPLPVGKSSVDTTISMKKKISNGTEWFGPGTEREHVQKKAKVVVNDPADAHASSVDHSAGSCPPPEDISAADLLWEGDTPGVAIINKQGWETYREAPGNPPMFSSGGYLWAHPVCEVSADDPTFLICMGEFTEPAPNKDQIGLYLPFPWSKDPSGFCLFEDPNLKQAEPTVECPTEEDIEPGGVYWDKGFATLEIENPQGWEPWQRSEESPSFLAVNDEHYTDLNCEVDGGNNTIMTCRGAGTIKTGGMSMFLAFPHQGQTCAVGFEEIEIKDLCSVGSRFCVFSGTCCPDGKTCDINGCHCNH